MSLIRTQDDTSLLVVVFLLSMVGPATFASTLTAVIMYPDSWLLQLVGYAVPSACFYLGIQPNDRYAPVHARRAQRSCPDHGGYNVSLRRIRSLIGTLLQDTRPATGSSPEAVADELSRA